MPDIIGKKYIYFNFSGLIIIPGLVSLFLYGLNLGIDFTGGTLLEVRIEAATPPPKENVLKIIENEKVTVASIVESGPRTYLIRMKPIEQTKNEEIKKALGSFGQVEQLRLETVGPVVGAELTAKAIWAVIIASIGIIIYITWAFRHVPKPASSFRFGVSAVVALLHDVLVVVGIFSILGHFYGVEIDSLFVTALLTVIGFSVHDTIVVFDRIRENLRKNIGGNFAQIANESILQTLTRSLSTSLTVVFVLSALLLFGGATIRWFVAALLIGIVSGTYSSIFNATPFLVVWQERTTKK